MQVIYSPITWCGGKVWLFDKLLKLVRGKQILEPFLGGGSIALNFAIRNFKVYGSDINMQLVNYFWNKINHGYEKIKKIAIHILDTHNHIELKNKLQAYQNNTSFDLENAAMFFLKNRLSYSGIMNNFHIRQFKKINGVYKAFRKGRPTNLFPNFPANRGGHPISVDDNKFKNISVQCHDFSELLISYPGDFAYCDPPYIDQESVYGCEFDHDKLYQILKNRQNWALSYPDNEKVQRMYRGFDKIKVKRALGKRGGNQNELLILSPDIAIRHRINELAGVA